MSKHARIRSIPVAEDPVPVPEPVIEPVPEPAPESDPVPDETPVVPDEAPLPEAAEVEVEVTPEPELPPYDPEAYAKQLEDRAKLLEALIEDQATRIGVLEAAQVDALVQLQMFQDAVIADMAAAKLLHQRAEADARVQGSIAATDAIASMRLWQVDRGGAVNNERQMMILAKTLRDAIARAAEIRPETVEDNIGAVRTAVARFYV